jgi:hypothetical protein
MSDERAKKRSKKRGAELREEKGKARNSQLIQLAKTDCVIMETLIKWDF